MTPRRIACLLALILMPLMPLSTSAQSFNCRTADRPDEVLICQNPRLASLDQRMSSLYFRLRNSLSGGERRRLEDDQRAWLRGRMGCGRDFGCIKDSYDQRIAELMNY